MFAQVELDLILLVKLNGTWYVKWFEFCTKWLVKLIPHLKRSVNPFRLRFLNVCLLSISLNVCLLLSTMQNCLFSPHFGAAGGHYSKPLVLDKCLWHTYHQFHQRFKSGFSYEILAPKITKLNVNREKLPKRLSYQKGFGKTLMKLTPAANFNNICFKR